ncbi:hypothetical protein E2C01_012640 [Portunus trituberculatus]|uniref:Uncharacterized protein n=1 Tax=Portunus trituberculatus TaxID=210409 RepID=A0A5B7DEN9_PORTR|nr:hypothetical protein [Portunus trituberculatus]
MPRRVPPPVCMKQVLSLFLGIFCVVVRISMISRLYRMSPSLFFSPSSRLPYLLVSILLTPPSVYKNT